MPRGSYYLPHHHLCYIVNNNDLFFWRRIKTITADKILEIKPENIRHDNRQRCPECEGTWIEHDSKRMETVCRDCGLVTSGPPGWVAGLVQIKYPVQYNFYAEAVGRGHNTKHGYYRAYYYFPDYTDNFD